MARVASAPTVKRLDTNQRKKIAFVMMALFLLMAGWVYLTHEKIARPVSPPEVVITTTDWGPSRPYDEWELGYQPGDDLSLPPPTR